MTFVVGLGINENYYLSNNVRVTATGRSLLILATFKRAKVGRYCKR